MKILGLHLKTDTHISVRWEHSLPDPVDHGVLFAASGRGRSANFVVMRAAQFLRHKSGKLAQPVTIYSLEDSGFFLTAKSSADGEALATAVASDNKVDAYFLAPHVHSPFRAVADTSFDSALAGLKALGTIATAEAARPGRKLLFWIGPGLGNRGTGAIAPDGKALLGFSTPGELGYSTSGKKGEEVKRDLFQKILWFSTFLRQARVAIDCFSIGEDNPVTDAWSPFLGLYLRLSNQTG
jgi:hypothetical protein